MFAMTMFEENKWVRTNEIEEITCDSESFMSTRSDRSTISASFSGSAEVPAEVPQAVEEVGNQNEDLEILSIIGTWKLQVIVEEVQETLQTTTAKLEEFVQFVIQNKKLNKPEQIPLYLHKGCTAADESVQLRNGGAADYLVRKVNLHGEWEKYHLDVVPGLRSIEGLMCASNCGEELCRAFINLHKAALNEQFDILGLKKVSRLCIKDVYIAEWNELVEIIN